MPRERPTERPDRPLREAPAEHPPIAINQPAATLPAHASWQLPALLFGTLLAVLAFAAWLLNSLLRFAREKRARMSLRDLGSTIAGVIGGFWLAWQGAGLAFTEALAYFQAAGAESPSMFAALVGLIAFCLLLPITGTLFTLILLKLQDILTRR